MGATFYITRKSSTAKTRSGMGPRVARRWSCVTGDRAPDLWALVPIIVIGLHHAPGPWDTTPMDLVTVEPSSP